MLIRLPSPQRKCVHNHLSLKISKGKGEGPNDLFFHESSDFYGRGCIQSKIAAPAGLAQLGGGEGEGPGLVRKENQRLCRVELLGSRIAERAAV